MHAALTPNAGCSPSPWGALTPGHEYSYSFPLIFFNVEDFEDAFSNLVINEQEYLCVELRVRLPSAQAGQPDRHVTIFQGAVSWDAINTTFQKQTTPKSICACCWRRQRAPACPLTLTPCPVPSSPAGERVEYIMMRGPKSKGHCQVAVSITDDEVAGSANGAGRRTPGSSASGTLRGLVKMAQVRLSVGAREEGLKGKRGREGGRKGYEMKGRAQAAPAVPFTDRP